MKNRFFSAAPLVVGEPARLEGDELHHAVRVARLHQSEEVEIFDGRGRTIVARVVSITRSDVELLVERELETHRESPLSIRLCAAIIQPDKFELVLQKGTELGVSRFTPLVTDRTEARAERIESKLERWQRILFEAVKQSGRSIIPSLDPPSSFGDALASEERKILFDGEAEETRRRDSAGSAVSIFIGPEGGWSAEELAAVRAANAEIRNLGPRRLRAETAAIAAVTAISLEAGDLRRSSP